MRCSVVNTMASTDVEGAPTPGGGDNKMKRDTGILLEHSCRIQTQGRWVLGIGTAATIGRQRQTTFPWVNSHAFLKHAHKLEALRPGFVSKWATDSALA